MKYINRLFLMLVGAAALTFASCSDDDDDYAPGAATNAEGINVYFDSANKSAQAIGPTDTEFTLTLQRNKADKAISVPLSVSEVNADLFTVPQSVDFSAGEQTKNITIKVSDKMEMFTTYLLSIGIDPAFTTPYAQSDVFPRMELSIVKEDYKPYATGTYYSEFWGDEDGNPLETEVVLEYSEILDNYRLAGCWGAGTGSVIFSWDKAENVELASNSIAVGLNADPYGPVTANTTEEPCTYNAADKSFTFPFEWTVSLGSFGPATDVFVIENIL